MLDTIVIVLESAAGVVRRIDKNALHLAGKVLLKRLQRKKVVALNKDVVEDVVIGDARPRVIGLGGVLDEDARLKTWAVILANPCQFEALLAVVHDARRCSFFC